MMQNQAAPQGRQESGGIVNTILAMVIGIMTMAGNTIGRLIGVFLLDREKEASRQYVQFYHAIDYGLLACKGFMVLCVLMAILSRFLGVEHLASMVEKFTILMFLLTVIMFIMFMMANLYLYYGAYQSGSIRLLATMFLGLFLSAVVLALSGVIPFLPLILIGVSIYKCRERRAFLKKYRHYLSFVLKAVVVTFVFQGLTDLAFFLTNAYGATFSSALENPRILRMANAGQLDILEFMLANYITGIAIAGFLAILGLYIYFRMLKRFFQKEEARGVSFGDCGKMLIVIPFVWLFFFISLLSLMDSGIFSGDQVLADVGAMDATTMSDAGASSGMGSGVWQASDDVDMTAPVLMHIPANTTPSVPDMPQDLPNLPQDAPDVSQTVVDTLPSSSTDASVDTSSTMEDHVSPITTAEATSDMGSGTVMEDAQGMMHGTIHTDANGDTIVEDAMQQPVMTMHGDLVTDAMHIYGADGMSMGDVSNGVIHGVDGLMDGRIVDLPDGARVIQDAQGMTLATVKPNGIVVNAQQMPIAVLKNV